MRYGTRTFQTADTVLHGDRNPDEVNQSLKWAPVSAIARFRRASRSAPADN
jgi:hypothetical protein